MNYNKKKCIFLGIGKKVLLTDGWSENADWQILGLLLIPLPFSPYIGFDMDPFRENKQEIRNYLSHLRFRHD